MTVAVFRIAKCILVAFVAVMLVSGCGGPNGTAATAPPHRSENGHKPLPAQTIVPRSFQSGPVHYRAAVVVLMYHAIGQPEQGDTIAADRFSAELRALLQSGYNFVTLQQFEAFVLRHRPVPPNAVLITFDDGLESLYTGAYPVLRDLRIPAASFMITGRVDVKPGVLTWPQIKTMQASGLVEFGGHTNALHMGVPISASSASAATVAHVYVLATHRVESDAMYRARVGADLTRCLDLLEQALNRPVAAFAYPFGAYDPELIELLQHVGYQVAFTTWGDAVSARSDPFRLGRINVGTMRTSAANIADTVAYIAAWSAQHPAAGPPEQVFPIWP